MLIYLSVIILGLVGLVALFASRQISQIALVIQQFKYNWITELGFLHLVTILVLDTLVMDDFIPAQASLAPTGNWAQFGKIP